jgi:hypothetical protein
MTDPTIQHLCRLIAQAPRAHSAKVARSLIDRRKKQIGQNEMLIERAGDRRKGE